MFQSTKSSTFECMQNGFLVSAQVLSNINSGTFAVTGKSIGLMLSPAADKVRSPPPPSLAGASLSAGSNTGAAARSGALPNQAQGRAGPEQRLRALQSPNGRSGFAAASKR